jgi:hypothetical protein
MLFARALSQGERAYCPDVSACALYVPEELGATVNENGEVMTPQDLPKSARPVAVTTEDIELGAPTVVVAQDTSKGQPENGSNNGGSTSAAGSPAQSVFNAPSKAAAEQQPVFYEQVKQAVAEKQAKPKVDPKFVEFDGCISVAERRNFARAWKDQFPPDTPSKDIELLRHDWLQREGFIDPKGEPTSAMIPLAVFEDYKRKAVHFAKTLNQRVSIDEVPF